jgi:hypothetical protein
VPDFIFFVLRKIYFIPLNNSLCPFYTPKQNIGSAYYPKQFKLVQCTPNLILSFLFLFLQVEFVITVDTIYVKIIITHFSMLFVGTL